MCWYWFQPLVYVKKSSYWVLAVSSVMLFAHSGTELIILGPVRYIQFEPWLNFICSSYSVAMIAVAPTYDESENVYDGKIIEALVHIGSIVVLVSWARVMFLLARFPTWGYYGLMFLAVLTNVLKVRPRSPLITYRQRKRQRLCFDRETWAKASRVRRCQGTKKIKKSRYEDWRCSVTATSTQLSCALFCDPIRVDPFSWEQMVFLDRCTIINDTFPGLVCTGERKTKSIFTRHAHCSLVILYNLRTIII